MKKISLIIFLLLSFTDPAFTQKSTIEKDSTKTEIDSTSLKINIPTDINKKFREFELNYNLNYPTSIFSEYINSKSIWLWTSYSMSNYSVNKNINEKTFSEIMSLLHDEYLRNSKFSFVQYMLGIAEYGAVGYLAYRHIRKWGFFK